jgi:hypothetical protein
LLVRRLAAATAALIALSVLAAPGLSAGPASAASPAARSIEPACPADRVGPSRYEDVPDDATFAQEIGCVSGHEIARGYDDTRYGPGAPVTRQQMALFLDRFRRGIGISDARFSSRFTDLEGRSQEVRDAVDTLVGLGVVRGTSEDRYDPDGLVTRGQMASFLHRLQQSVEVNVVRAFDPKAFPSREDAFSDDDGSVHEETTNGLAAAGLVQGVEPGTYAPLRPVTRGQMAGFLSRHLSYLVEQGSIGSAYADPVRVRGDARLDGTGADPFRGGFEVVPEDDAPSALVRPDGNDVFTLGSSEGRSQVDLYIAMGVEVADVLEVVYRPWALQASEFTLVLDRVDPPRGVAATPATEQGATLGTVRLTGRDAAEETTRERGGAGPDGQCRTADDEPLAADGTVPPAEPGSPDLDVDLAPQDCYRYTVTEVSPWTPERGRASTATNVVQPADPDRTAPQLVEVVEEPDGRSVRLRYDEPVVLLGRWQRPDVRQLQLGRRALPGQRVRRARGGGRARHHLRHGARALLRRHLRRAGWRATRPATRPRLGARTSAELRAQAVALSRARGCARR